MPNMCFTYYGERRTADSGQRMADGGRQFAMWRMPPTQHEKYNFEIVKYFVFSNSSYIFHNVIESDLGIQFDLEFGPLNTALSIFLWIYWFYTIFLDSRTSTILKISLILLRHHF